MSKKLDSEFEQHEADAVPFFAHLLSDQSDLSAESGATNYCYDNPCPTKKYPSDGDEPTSSLYDR